MSFVEEVIGALEPYVGRTVADTCVRATALAIGKTSDSLCADDMSQLEVNIRRLLGPVAPATTIDVILSTIEGGAR